MARLQDEDSALLAEFAGAGNRVGVALLLDLGFDVSSRPVGAEPADTGLHLAVWRGRTGAVNLLIPAGRRWKPRTARADRAGPAVRAMVQQSDWTPHDSTAILRRCWPRAPTRRR